MNFLVDYLLGAVRLQDTAAVPVEVLQRIGILEQKANAGNIVLWGYQDFNAGDITSNSVTITSNDADTEPINLSNIVQGIYGITKADNIDQYVYTGSTTLFSSKVNITLQTGNIFSLSGIPYSGHTVRIWFAYRYARIPANYSIAPAIVDEGRISQLDEAFVNETEFAVEKAGLIDLINQVDSNIILRQAVLDKDLTVPPITPTLGDRYAVTGGTGDWNLGDGIYQWSGTVWTFEAFVNGWQFEVIDETREYRWNGTELIPRPTAVDHDSTLNKKGLGTWHLREATATLLENYTLSNVQLLDAYNNRHSHANKTVLDSIIESDITNGRQTTIDFGTHNSNTDIHTNATEKSNNSNHIANNDIHVTLQFKSDTTSHLADTTIHVTAQNKIDWNSAVTHTSDSNIHVTAQNKIDWNAAKSSIDNHLLDTDNPHSTTASQVGAVTANAPITGATKTKITYGSNGLVTAGADLADTDIPQLPQSKITNLVDDLATKADNSLLANYVDLSTDQTVNGIKTFERAKASTTPDMSDDENLFATLKNVKDNAGGTVKFLLTDTNYN